MKANTQWKLNRNPWYKSTREALKTHGRRYKEELLYIQAAVQSLAGHNPLYSRRRKRDQHCSGTSFLSPTGEGDEEEKDSQSFPGESPGIGEERLWDPPADQNCLYSFSGDSQSSQITTPEGTPFSAVPSLGGRPWAAGRFTLLLRFSSPKPDPDLILCCYTSNKPGTRAWFILAISHFSVRLQVRW